MAEQPALQQAKEQLSELIKAARSGAIIPIRLPGQLEAIEALLAKADEEAKAAAEAAKTAAGSSEGDLADTAAFISHAIHELRTPMTSIRGYADMLNSPAMGQINEMQKQFLDTIRTNARRMEGLLTDVSDVSKLRAAKLKLNAKMDLFKNIAMMVQKSVDPMAAEMKRKFTMDIPSGLPTLNIDGELLSKALVKLIENGLRYSAEETGEVNLTAANEDNTLVITIADNGIGMTPDEIKQLGTLYYRGDNDTVRAYKGSGMGVPIAFGVIKLLGGTIDVESEPGKGTKLKIRIKGMS